MQTTMSRQLHWTHDVQSGTGYATSLVPTGQWYRGVLYRAAMPAVQLPPYQQQRDPSDPSTWRHTGR